jgi:CheY-like chemotaxis protein
MSTATVAPTILIIEDYPDTRELLAALLRGKGYRVIEAEDGVEGVLKAGQNLPDLVIMDLALPEMDGIEATRRIRDNPKLANVPIFVLSAYLTEEVKTDARVAGCLEFFRKPFDADLLLRKIGTALAQH